MRIAYPRVFSALCFLGFGLTSCVSETLKDHQPVADPERYETSGEKKVEAPDFNEQRIEAAVDAVSVDRGGKLLQDLQWLISQKQLAYPAIFKALPNVSTRARANLLYVLGFSRTDESRQVLVANLHDPDSVVRYEAAAGLLNHGDMTAVPILIDFLSSKDKQARYKAIEALRLGTGKDFGYQFAAPDELRSASVIKWNEWWSLEKERLMRRAPESNKG